MHRGVVSEFDEHRGWGSIRDVRGGEHFFHCTAIANGSRTIEVGVSVRFRVVPGHLGQWEAEAVEAVPERAETGRQ